MCVVCACPCKLWHALAGRKVNTKCVDDLVAFKIDRSTNINKDVALGACLEPQPPPAAAGRGPEALGRTQWDKIVF